jgi:hypothetical protein
MNLQTIMSDEKLSKKIESIQNYKKDPFLTIFGFDRKLFYFKEKIWAYSAGFHFKREESENVTGVFHLYYTLNNNVIIDIKPYDDSKKFTNDEVKYIENSITTHSRYVEMIQTHKGFFSDLNVLVIDKKTPTWSAWNKEVGRDNHNSYTTILTVDSVEFEILICTIENESPIQIEYIQISQEDESFNKAFEVLEIIKNELNSLYETWVSEISLI